MIAGRSRIKIWFVVLALVLICSCAPAGIENRIRKILSSKEMQKVRVGMEIVDLSTGTSLFDWNEHQPMIPASNMKLVVAAAAINYLGAAYEFKTVAATDGKNLIVIGGGDPLLGDRTYCEKLGIEPQSIVGGIVAELKSQSIHTIDNIIVDSTFFDDQLVHPSWPRDQLNAAYACEVCGLNYNANCIEITTRKVGSICRVSAQPYTGYVHIVDDTRAASKGPTRVGAYRNSVPNKITIKGTCSGEYSFDVAIERPAAYFGYLLAEQMAQQGVSVTGRLFEQSYSQRDDLQLLKRYATPLTEVLRRCNEDSFGLAADSLVKAISAEKRIQKSHGSWEHGLALVGLYLRNLGVEEQEFVLDDGRGLSRVNRLSAHSVVAVLRNMYNRPEWGLFRESLAQGGEGTLSRYFKDPKYRNKVFGKTGYINGVRTFSGVCETDRGTIAFSILTEGGTYKVRHRINDIAKALVDEL